MNKKILVLTASLFAVSAYSQNSAQNEYVEWKLSQNEYENFDISKYITPDIVRNQLDFSFDFRSYNSHTDNSSSNMDSRFESSDLTGNISSTFSRYVNIRRRISNLTGNLSFVGNNSSYESTSTINNVDSESSSFRQNWQNSLYLNWSNKWYFSNLFFMDYGIRSNTSYDFAHNKTKNQSEDINEKQKTFSLNISPQIGIGYGRIETVRDARQAVHIANALSKKGVLNRKLSNDELFELSQIISTVKNKRFLDSRLHLIEEITTLDSFFEDNDLLANNGAAYFTTLNDMWQYGGLFPRNSGYEISFIVRPYYDYRNIKFSPEIRDLITNLNQHFISLNFSYEKPFKLNWQHSLFAEVSGGIGSSSQKNIQTDNDYKISGKYDKFYASANYSLGYYPNTRTYIRLSASQFISNLVYDDDGNSKNYESMLSAGLYYYFSPNFRLTSDCGFRYSPNRSKGNEGIYSNRNAFQSFFNVRLTYFIF